MDEYIKPLLSIGTISGVVSAIWYLFSKLVLEKEKKKINEDLVKLKSEIDKQRDKHLFLFKERYRNEIDAYDVVWKNLTELMMLLKQCSGISSAYIQGINKNEENKETLNKELRIINESIKEKYDDAERSYYEKNRIFLKKPISIQKMSYSRHLY